MLQVLILGLSCRDQQPSTSLAPPLEKRVLLRQGSVLGRDEKAVLIPVPYL